LTLSRARQCASRWRAIRGGLPARLIYLEDDVVFGTLNPSINALAGARLKDPANRKSTRHPAGHLGRECTALVIGAGASHVAAIEPAAEHSNTSAANACVLANLGKSPQTDSDLAELGRCRIAASP
jgi:hypothetical protein